MRILAESIGVDIILNNKGIPSFGQAINTETTMRARAADHGAHAITIELGNPQVYQQEMIERGVQGVENALIRLGVIRGVTLGSSPETIICKKSYWIYVDQGGLLEVPVELVEKVEKGQIIGILKDPFGNIKKTYRAPEAGIVIGKTSNPVNMSGGRIIHLGIIEDK
jgi:predicted deacylase